MLQSYVGGGIAGLRRRGLWAKRDEGAVGYGLWMVCGCASQQSNSDDLLEPRVDGIWPGRVRVKVGLEEGTEGDRGASGACA